MPLKEFSLEESEFLMPVSHMLSILDYSGTDYLSLIM